MPSGDLLKVLSRGLIFAAASLALFTLLSDAPALPPQVAFSQAHQAFTHGYLEDAQAQAEHGYARFLYSDPVWARKFQLLAASAMAWRGLNTDVLTLLSDDHIPWIGDESSVERAALQVGALTRLHQLAEADGLLSEVRHYCVAVDSGYCGRVLLAEGLLLLERGRTEQAKQAFEKSLSAAQRSGDEFLAGTALLNLGNVASQQERHETALSYYEASERKALALDARDLQQVALGDEGWEQYKLGNAENALSSFLEAAKRAASLGDRGYEVQWLTPAALAYVAMGQFDMAERYDLRAIALARKIGKKQSIIDASEDLARLYVGRERPDDADQYAGAALILSQETGNRLDFLQCNLLQGQAASLRRDWQRSSELLLGVIESPDSPASMKWQAQHALGRMYEDKGDAVSARRSYEAALALIEGARAGLNRETSRLTFLENATSIYDDYIHLLVNEGKTQEALEAADWSRARTLQQGLGSIAAVGVHAGAKLRTVSAEVAGAPRLNAIEIARRTNSTLLFYWLGEKQSYLWVISPEQTRFVTLPPKSAILPTMERYRRAVLGLKDPLRAGAGDVAADGGSLYQTLVAPAAKQLRPDRPMVLFVDGEMGQLNFETLLAPSPSPHFWIEDATVLQAPSIRMFAETAREVSNARRSADTMLLFGDTVPAGAEFRPLPMAAQEMETVKGYFAGTAKVVQGAKATPAAYLTSDPAQFDYIHFVAHGTASRTDPLESAVILSQGGAGEDSYKLYAREIVRHPINARLVTISACNSSGSKSFAGEGLVGLSWAFLRAGAHNAIGSLWEVSDASTPELMDTLYRELQRGEPPASALRAAKLSLIHSGGHFSRPFYWAPFQLYAGR